MDIATEFPSLVSDDLLSLRPAVPAEWIPALRSGLKKIEALQKAEGRVVMISDVKEKYENLSILYRCDDPDIEAVIEAMEIRIPAKGRRVRALIPRLIDAMKSLGAVEFVVLREIYRPGSQKDFKWSPEMKTSHESLREVGAIEDSTVTEFGEYLLRVQDILLITVTIFGNFYTAKTWFQNSYLEEFGGLSPTEMVAWDRHEELRDHVQRRLNEKPGPESWHDDSRPATEQDANPRIEIYKDPERFGWIVKTTDDTKIPFRSSQYMTDSATLCFDAWRAIEDFELKEDEEKDWYPFT